MLIKIVKADPLPAGYTKICVDELLLDIKGGKILMSEYAGRARRLFVKKDEVYFADFTDDGETMSSRRCSLEQFLVGISSAGHSDGLKYHLFHDLTEMFQYIKKNNLKTW